MQRDSDNRDVVYKAQTSVTAADDIGMTFSRLEAASSTSRAAVAWDICATDEELSISAEESGANDGCLLVQSTNGSRSALRCPSPLLGIE